MMSALDPETAADPGPEASGTPRWWSLLRNEVSGQTKMFLNESLATKTTVRVGGPARYYAEPASIADLRNLWLSAQSNGVEVFLLGRGSNLLVMDQGFDGLVIRLNHPFWRAVEVRDGRVHAMAGARLKQVCASAAAEGIGGFEFLEGIPGSVGGSLRMNAGAMGGWIFDVVGTVCFMSPDGEVHKWDRDRFTAGYRRCEELISSVALGAVFEAKSFAGSVEIRRQIDAYAETRKSSQPREPSAGCIFKNPEGNHSGKLIDELGIKGSSVGGAEVSTIHGNFIINRDHASCSDILELIRKVRSEVLEKRGVLLEPEVLLLGAKWEDVL